MLQGIKYNILKSPFYTYIEATQNNFDLEDVFLVSFPKSGNTWIRFMLTGLYLWEMDQGRSEPNYFNIHTYVKDIHLEKIGKRLHYSGMPRIIKSHRLFSSNYTRVIYVIRDVRDVMISWFHFVNRNQIKFHSFDDFIRSPYHGVKAWKYHINSWIDSTTNTNKKLLLLRYEDLIDAPMTGLKSMLDFINVSFDEKALNWVLQQTSKNKIKLLETTFGRARTSITPFLRKGEKQQWKSEISDANKEYILQIAGDTLKKFAYEI